MYDGTQAIEEGEARAEPAAALSLAVRRLVARAAAHDRSTMQHSARVVRLARRVGSAMGLERSELRHVALVALLHDCLLYTSPSPRD